MIAPEESCSSRKGFSNTPVRGSDGPMARTITFFGWVPVTIKPPMSTLSPVSTKVRVEMLPKIVGPGGGIAEVRSYPITSRLTPSGEVAVISEACP